MSTTLPSHLRNEGADISGMAVRRIVRSILWLHAAFLAGGGALLLTVSDTQVVRDHLTGVYFVFTIFAAVVVLVNGTQLTGRERTSWLLLGGASLCWHLSSAYLNVVLVPRGPVPMPSAADFGFLAFIPLAIAGLILRLPRRAERRSAAQWIDGLAAALAAMALSAAVLLDAAVGRSGISDTEVAMLTIYVAGDALLLGFIVAALALNGWRIDRASALVAIGLFTFWVADSSFALTRTQQNDGGLSVFSIGWTLAVLLFAFASFSAVRASRDKPAVRHSSGRAEIYSPLAFAALGLAIMIVAAIVDVHPLAVVLAAMALAAMLLRLGLSLVENNRMLVASQDEALTDALTGIGNRRALLRDLDAAIAGGRTTTLVLFDLDGFKNYNDVFGHPAGDALLVRLAHNLRDRVDGGREGGAYRIGGDEFCALLHCDADSAQLADLAEALSEAGEGFQIGASLGAVHLPPEAGTASDAMRLVDQRMYAAKNSKRASARAQSSEVLVRALCERMPPMRRHLDAVADHAVNTALELGLDDEIAARAAHAARLHDIGCMAIPDAILGKPGPLSDEEAAFVRRHPLAGERILEAAPALRHLAPLVRAIQEHHDGSGYPDGLSGDRIPIESRVIAVCDAFDTMIEKRPFRAAVDRQSAIAELRSRAGSQFHPEVVEAFVRSLATTSAGDRAAA